MAHGERRPRQPAADNPAFRADLRAARLAAEQRGILTLDELRRCGLNRTAVSVRVRRGHLHRVHRGVYAVGHPALTLEAALLAAVKACGPGAVLSHVSAAAVWGLIDWDESWIPDVTIRGGSPRRPQGVRVHRTAALIPRDVTVRSDIPITSPARTIADAAAQLAPRFLRRITREALGQGWVNLAQISEVLNRLGPRRGSRSLRSIVAEQPAPTRSILEDVVLDLIVSGGFKRPDVNVPLRLEGLWVVPDFRWPRERLVVEADGARWHGNELARREDAERQALLEAHGERVLRVTWAQATTQPRRTLDRLAGAGAPREHRAAG